MSTTMNFFIDFVIGMWSSPTLTGTRPPPCSGFTLTMVDSHRAVLFGGTGHGGKKFKHVYILDLDRMVSYICQHTNSGSGEVCRGNSTGPGLID